MKAPSLDVSNRWSFGKYLLSGISASFSASAIVSSPHSMTSSMVMPVATPLGLFCLSALRRRVSRHPAATFSRTSSREVVSPRERYLGARGHAVAPADAANALRGLPHHLSEVDLARDTSRRCARSTSARSRLTWPSPGPACRGNGPRRRGGTRSSPSSSPR